MPKRKCRNSSCLAGWENSGLVITYDVAKKLPGQSTHGFKRLDTFGSGWMARKYSTAGVAIALHKPGEGIDHGVFRIAGALE